MSRDIGTTGSQPYRVTIKGAKKTKKQPPISAVATLTGDRKWAEKTVPKNTPAPHEGAAISSSPGPRLEAATQTKRNPSFQITLGDVYYDPSLKEAWLKGGRIEHLPGGGRRIFYPSEPLTGKNDSPGWSPADREIVKHIHDKTLGPARRGFELATEMTGVPALARSAVDLIEHPGVGAAVASSVNAAILIPGLRSADIGARLTRAAVKGVEAEAAVKVSRSAEKAIRPALEASQARARVHVTISAQLEPAEAKTAIEQLDHAAVQHADGLSRATKKARGGKLADHRAEHADDLYRQLDSELHGGTLPSGVGTAVEPRVQPAGPLGAGSGDRGVPSVEGAAAPRVGGHSRGRAADAFAEATPEDFLTAQRGNTRAWNLTEHPAEELAGGRSFLSRDGQTGFHLDPEGDLQNVFNNGTIRGAGAEAVKAAVKQGAKTLDAYDGFLPGYYEKFGFREVGRMKFVDEYAPDGWDFAKNGRPDVVFMAHNAPASTPIREFANWDAAKQYARDAASPARLADETGSLTPGAFYTPAAERAPRMSRYHDVTQQFPLSPSLITGHGQRLLDRFSEIVGARVDPLRDSTSALERGVGKVLTPISSRARVPKQAGKIAVRKEASRDRARFGNELSAIRGTDLHVPFTNRPPREAAHWWYAQLPPEYRNAEGLSLVRDKLVGEHDRITSGEMLDELRTRLHELEVDRRAAFAAGEVADAFMYSSSIEDLKAVMADVASGQRLKDVATAIRKMENLIAKPPEVEDGVIEGLRALARDRQEIFVAAGKLDAEVAANRNGLICRWLGLDPTGDEVFMGHRMGKVRGSRPQGVPGSISVGRTRTPPGLTQKNQLVLVRSGRVRMELDAAIEDWQAAGVYQMHNLTKDILGRLGEPIVGKPKPDYIVVNPRGHEIPRTWKLVDTDQAAAEGFDAAEVVVRDAEEYAHKYMAATLEEISAMMREAADLGHLEDLRQVPVDVAQRFFRQFTTPKLTVTNPTAIKQTVNLFANAMDFVNDAVYVSIIYSNPGYIPANALGNLVFAGAQQGAFLPINLIRAGQILSGPKGLLRLIEAEVGVGASQAAMSATSALRSVGHVMNSIADNPFRVSAFVHEAARMGVIPKTKPWLTKKDFDALEAFIRDPRNLAVLNDISDRSNQALVDFERSGGLERALAHRFLFVWAWMRGATRYPGRFALDHPIRTALTAYIAYDQQDTIKDHLEHGAVPTWLKWGLKAGTTSVFGHKYPRILPTGPISPAGTAIQVAQALTSQPGSQPAYQFINPWMRALVQIVKREDQYGNEIGYAASAKDAGTRLAPDIGLARDLLHPAKTVADAGLYPEDVTWQGRMKRAARVIPFAINPEVAKKTAARQVGASSAPSPEEKQKAYVAKIEKQLGELPPDVRLAAMSKASYMHMEDKLMKDLGVKKLTDKQRTALKVELLVGTNPDWADSADYLRAEVKDANPLSLPTIDSVVEEALGWTALSTYAGVAGQMERVNAASR